jgi:drug/metabolite transporter (DMT)-like permease
MNRVAKAAASTATSIDVTSPQFFVSTLAGPLILKIDGTNQTVMADLPATHFGTRLWRQLAFISMLQYGGVIAMNLSSFFLSASVTQTIKCLEPIFTVVFGALLKQAWPSYARCFALSMICMGLYLTTSSETGEDMSVGTGFSVSRQTRHLCVSHSKSSSL